MAKKNQKKIETLVSFFKSIAHPTRMGVIQLLLQKEQMSVTAICDSLDLEQSLASHHLASMRKTGILSCRRDGKNIYYSLGNPIVKTLIESVEAQIGKK
ncbi:MAG: metalloregulator ArsR/SmtB family transcription factor [Thermonemataceae bacterium]|nr:metalloregulator ArsR/SmtB family transcription factor [Thermonemataceae bacterium]